MKVFCEYFEAVPFYLIMVLNKILFKIGLEKTPELLAQMEVASPDFNRGYNGQLVPSSRNAKNFLLLKKEIPKINSGIFYLVFCKLFETPKSE